MIQDRKILIVSGKDSESFLQQIVTNDIKKIEGLQYNLLLSPQGKLLHDIFILKVAENSYLLDCHKGGIDDVMGIFSKYKLGAQVQFTIDDSINVIDSPEGHRDPRHIDFGFRSYSALSSDELRDYSDIYYKLSLPQLYIDFDSGKYFPFDIGLHNFNAISYTKGCYIGQEVITRTFHSGVMRKKVYRITSSRDLEGKCDLYMGEQKVGVIIGLYGNKRALALCNSTLVNDTLLASTSDGNEIKFLKN
jgi:folate-binding protein YgfZ